MKRGEATSNLRRQILNCSICPRLVDHRERVARVKRKAYQDWDYWGQPVPSFGSETARLVIVGLAPGAHGANRTGRIFTGDSSGDLLYATLYRCGFCNHPSSTHADDGLQLIDTYITAALHCVPPQNKPLRAELQACQGYLEREMAFLENVRVVVTLGGIAWKAFLDSWLKLGRFLSSPRPKFGHKAEFDLDERILLIGSYHPSRQNTQTGRLTVEMFKSVFERAKKVIGGR
jgi:uracil-DNA glycosylase family 4